MAAIVPNITSSTITYKDRKERINSLHVPLFSSEWKYFPKFSNRLSFTSHWPEQGHMPPLLSCPDPITNKGNRASLRLVVIHPLELDPSSFSQPILEQSWTSLTGERNDWMLVDQHIVNTSTKDKCHLLPLHDSA